MIANDCKMIATKPLCFLTLLLQQNKSARAAKQAKYIKEARTMGIRILPADVNLSAVSWIMDKDKNAIRRGLMSIKGVGVSAAECVTDHAPFKDIEELISTCPARSVTGGKKWASSQQLTGTMRRLQEAGALRSLGVTP